MTAELREQGAELATCLIERAMERDDTKADIDIPREVNKQFPTMKLNG